jgi:hypothetical protein
MLRPCIFFQTPWNGTYPCSGTRIVALLSFANEPNFFWQHLKAAPDGVFAVKQFVISIERACNLPLVCAISMENE